VHSLLKFNSKEKFVRFCYLLVVFITQHFTFFCKRLPVLPVIFVKMTLFNTVHCDG